MIRLVLKWSSPSDSRLRFLTGRILYEAGRTQEGLWNMQAAITGCPKTPEWADETIYYAQALSLDGEFNDLPAAISLLKEAIPYCDNVAREAIDVFC